MSQHFAIIQRFDGKRFVVGVGRETGQKVDQKQEDRQSIHDSEAKQATMGHTSPSHGSERDTCVSTERANMCSNQDNLSAAEIRTHDLV